LSITAAVGGEKNGPRTKLRKRDKSTKKPAPIGHDGRNEKKRTQGSQDEQKKGDRRKGNGTEEYLLQPD